MNAGRWTFAFFWLWSSLATMANAEKICGEVRVRNDIYNLIPKLQNCSVINGSLHIVLIDTAKSSDFEMMQFPLLREITDYMIVYRVSGLLNLGRLFPNLMLIRGMHTKEFPGRTLMIHDNPDLKEIGLDSLTNITHGSVIISKNQKLCFATTIDWGEITNGVSNNTNIISNIEAGRCPGCSGLGCPNDRCWSSQKSRCQYDNKLKGCHPLCAGGCSKNNSVNHCFVCAGFIVNGACIKECPDYMVSHGRTCLTKEACLSIEVKREESTVDDLNTNYIPFEGVCRDECPYGFEVTSDNKSCTPCKKTTYGNCRRHCIGFKISDDMLKGNEEYRLKLFPNCTTIKSLEIEVKYGTSEYVERRLEEYLGKVEVILDQLKIIRSYSLTSLNFLQNLKEIRGEHIFNKMALVVRSNKNLQKLFSSKDNKTRQVKILNGTVSFHFNPKLCMSEIYKFGNLSTLPPFSDLEVSNISNGDQFPCTVYKLAVDIVKIDRQSILLRMQKPVEVDHLERYLVYFIEASKWNETTEITECEDTSWKIDDISSKKVLNDTTEIYHVITNLEPNTEYIYYVKTYTVASKTTMSSIFRNKTLPSKPSAPQYVTAQPISSSVVELKWRPPTHPHGKLVKYIIRGYQLNDNLLDGRSYCKNITSKGDGVSYKSVSSIIEPVSVGQSCEKQCELHKSINNDICNLFEHGLDIYLIPLSRRKYMFELCSNFINGFINAKCLEIQYSDDTYFQSNVDENCTEKWSIGYEPNNFIKSNSSSQISFYYEINENFTSFNITKLNHFSQYVLSLLVCREIVEQELNLNKSIDSCSKETLVSFRTLKNSQADAINKNKTKVKVDNRTVNISWEEPKLINSLIHSFQLEYKLLSAYSFTTVCITMEEYYTGGRSYTIKNIMSGEYEFRIRAISLAGEGPYTDLIKFVIIDYSPENLHLIIMILFFGCILIVLMGVIIRTYFSRKLSQRHSMYNLTNNPIYVGMYIEDEWELAREDVVIQKVLGRGTFGTVHEGKLMPHNIPCAVKSVSKTNFLRYHAEFLNEAAIMKKFSEAYHIVKLLGVVTKSHPPLLVMELMGLGDLKSVLSKYKGSDDPPPPGRYTQIRMSAQIADGMAFLEYNKFIHRDLAARNCMVANDMTVKIGDFGMSRQIYTGDYYRKGNKGDMPIRWMAPESLSEGIFTSQSDVWSYGVVIWEIMTLGEQPYAGKGNNEVMAHVLDGNLLNLPIFCPDILAGIVRLCWNWTASKRPSFLKIVEKLDVYLDDVFRSVSFCHNCHNTHNDSPADQSLMSPCTTYEEDVDNESTSLEGDDSVAVFHVDKNKMSNGNLPSM